MEAVAASVPVLNIYLPHTDNASPINPTYFDYLDAVMNNRDLGPLYYPGCVNIIDRREFVDWLRNKSIQDIPLEPTLQKEYLEKYLGITNQSSTLRIMASLETLYDKRN